MQTWLESEVYVVRELGRVFLSEGRFALARRIFAGLIELDRNDGYAHAGLGMAQAKLGEVKAADRALSEAVRIDPHNWTAALCLTELRLKQGPSSPARDAAHLAERATRSDECPAPLRRRAEHLIRITQ